MDGKIACSKPAKFRGPRTLNQGLDFRCLCRGHVVTPFLLKKVYTQRVTTVFSSINIRMEAILDLAVPTKDSLRDPRGKKA